MLAGCRAGETATMSEGRAGGAASGQGARRRGASGATVALLGTAVVATPIIALVVKVNRASSRWHAYDPYRPMPTFLHPKDSDSRI
jgi:hypothetical protein